MNSNSERLWLRMVAARVCHGPMCQRFGDVLKIAAPLSLRHRDGQIDSARNISCAKTCLVVEL